MHFGARSSSRVGNLVLVAKYNFFLHMRRFQKTFPFSPPSPILGLNDFPFTRENLDFRLCGRVGSNRKMRAKFEKRATLVRVFFMVGLGYICDFGPFGPVLAENSVHGRLFWAQNSPKWPKIAQNSHLGQMQAGGWEALRHHSYMETQPLGPK